MKIIKLNVNNNLKILELVSRKMHILSDQETRSIILALKSAQLGKEAVDIVTEWWSGGYYNQFYKDEVCFFSISIFCHF